MLTFKHANSANPDFISMVRKLDAELAVIDGEEHAFYAQYNKIDKLKNVVIAYWNNVPIACGAIKPFDSVTVEVKRMFTLPEFRGKGVASSVLNELEKLAAELGYKRCVLETGVRQPDAIRLYEKNGYCSIPNYGQYAGIENSRCFEKNISAVN